MKRKVGAIVECIAILGILLVVLSKTDGLVERKASRQKYEPFLEQEQDFDVLFFGTSHILNGIFPMELWNDYGIVSYNFGGHGNELATTYWTMMNALDYTEPKLVVIDCMLLSSNEKICGDFDYVHLSFDAFPLSRNKFYAVNDLVNDEKKKWDLLCPFTVYHNRWNELGQEDFESKPTVTKGAEMKIAVATPAQTNIVAQDCKMEEDTLAVEYLKKMVEECQSRNIEVLLTYLPFPASEAEQMEANRVYDIAKEYEINYINFLELDVVDYQTDCFDAISHLNPAGGKKVTNYLGQYIISNYEIPNQQENPKYVEWEKDWDDYTAYKLELLKEQKDLKNYLMLLADNNYDLYIEINDPSIFQDEQCCRLLNNLGVNDLPVLKDIVDIENGNEAAIHIEVKDKETQQIVDSVSFDYIYDQSIITTEVLRP